MGCRLFLYKEKFSSSTSDSKEVNQVPSKMLRLNSE